MITLRRPRRTRQDNIVPMINVAFLLLIFFLMSAVIVPSAPVDIAAPSAPDKPGEIEGANLFVGPNGVLIGENGAAIQYLSEFAGMPVAISADASLLASEFVRIVATLRSAGITEIHLMARSDFK